MDKKVRLGDGNEYTLSPFSIGDHRRFMEARKTDESGFDPSLMLIHRSIVRHHPDVTLEKLSDELLNFAILGDVFLATLEVSGIKVQENLAGELSSASAK